MFRKKFFGFTMIFATFIDVVIADNKASLARNICEFEDLLIEAEVDFEFPFSTFI